MRDTARDEVRFVGQGGAELRALLWRGPTDADRPCPGVVFVHDALGLDAAMLAACERLAAPGRAVLAVDLYSREGAPGAPGAPAAERRAAGDARALARAVPDRRVIADLDAALARLAREPDVDAERIALVGVGAGGTWAFLAACASARPAAVVDVGGRLVHDELDRETPLQPLEMALNLGAPVLAVFAADDPAVPPGELEHVRATLERFARELELHVVPVAAEHLVGAEAVWSLADAFLARDA